MSEPSPGSDRRAPSRPGGSLRRAVTGFVQTLLAAVAGGIVLGCGIAALTVRLDPVLATHTRDVAALFGWGALVYGLLALGPGLVAAVVVAALRAPGRGDGHWTGRLARVLLFATVAAPILYLLLLPDLGLSHRLLTDALSAYGAARILHIGAFGALCLAVGALVARIARGPVGRRLLGAAWIVLVANTFVFALAHAPTAEPADEAEAANVQADEAPMQVQERSDDAAPAPVFLLCVDGADPHVVDELLAAGELPHLAALAERGVYGPLATLEPTLSPVVWTTLATGRTPDDHGIRQFVYARVPRVSKPVAQFPLHTGLNFELIPRIESLTGAKIRAPYTTGMRRVEAMWNIVDRRYPVGVYRWLMTWPAERVDGFSVAGGIAWAGLEPSADDATYPPDLFRGLPYGRLPKPSDAEIEALLGSLPAEGKPIRRQAVATLRDPSVPEIAALVDRHRPALVAASFFPVDAVQHLYGRHRGSDRPVAGAVDAFYRLTDRRLGELLAALPDDVRAEARILVVSDHGYDFEANHHTDAPPGIFFAAGPGIAQGARVDDLDVYDIAPLVLRLLDLPVADDMPATQEGRYAKILDPAWAAAHPEQRVATWETGSHRGDVTDGDQPLFDPEVEEVLRSLGYVD